MAKSQIFKPSAAAGEVSFNVVPLVDVAFLMILFFILTSQLANNAMSALNLSSVVDAQAPKIKDKDKTLANKVIVNITSSEPIGGADGLLDTGARAGQARQYEVSGNPVALEDIEKLTRMIKAHRDDSVKKGVKPEDFIVVIRADRRVSYEFVSPVMLAAAGAGVSKMEVTVADVPSAGSGS